MLKINELTNNLLHHISHFSISHPGIAQPQIGEGYLPAAVMSAKARCTISLSSR
jgi:hypothetical protein